MANDNSAPGSIPLRVLILQLYAYLCESQWLVYDYDCQFEKNIDFVVCDPNFATV